MACSDEGVGTVTEALPHQRAGSLKGQGFWPQDGHRRVERDLGEQGVVGMLLSRAEREDEEHG